MMSARDAMLTRRSVRRYRPEAPSRAELEEVLRLATLAPSAMNRQDWHFTVVSSETVRRGVACAVEEAWRELTRGESGVAEALATYAGNFSAFTTAPVLVLAHVRRTPAFLCELLRERADRVVGSQASAWMAVQNLQLAAHCMGLGCCVYSGCVAAERAIAEWARIPPGRVLIGLVTLGYPAEEPLGGARKPLAEVTDWIA